MKKELDSIILTRQELEIMKVVWDRGSATVRQVRDAIAQRKPTAYTTILTLMNILEAKGALSHVRAGRAFVYQPVLTRAQATRNQLHDLRQRLFDGDAVKLILALVESGALSTEELARLRGDLDSRLQNHAA